MTYIFKARDPGSDDGIALVIIAADSREEADAILGKHCLAKGRSGLDWDCTEQSNPKIKFSNLEEK